MKVDDKRGKTSGMTSDIHMASSSCHNCHSHLRLADCPTQLDPEQALEAKTDALFPQQVMFP